MIARANTGGTLVGLRAAANIAAAMLWIAAGSAYKTA